jgi:hypothetical protein
LAYAPSSPIREIIELLLNFGAKFSKDLLTPRGGGNYVMHKALEDRFFIARRWAILETVLGKSANIMSLDAR